MTRAVVLVAAAGCAAVGCAGQRPVDSDALPTLATPNIVEATLRCDADDATWTLEILADAWTGGGVTSWTVDGEYVETHKVFSVVVAEDGTSDELLLSLSVVADWREAQAGSKTNFTCASDPNVVFVLDDVDGDPVACRGWGPNPAIWDGVSGVTACE